MKSRSVTFNLIAAFLLLAFAWSVWHSSAQTAQSNSSTYSKQAIACSLIRVVDGDTAVFSCDGWHRSEHTRIIGYNSPDRCQPLYREATEWLIQVLAGGTITLETKGRDKYRRMLAKVYVDGKRISPPRYLTAKRKKCK